MFFFFFGFNSKQCNISLIKEDYKGEGNKGGGKKRKGGGEAGQGGGKAPFSQSSHGGEGESFFTGRWGALMVEMENSHGRDGKILFF